MAEVAGGEYWYVIYKAIGDFSDLIKDAAAARAEMAALQKATQSQGQAETDAANKAAVAHDKDTQSILAQKRAYDQLAESAKAANVQTLYGGRQDMGQHLSDLGQEQRWSELLLRQRNLGFTSPQAAYSWRQMELQQSYLMNRARFGATSSGTGFTTPNEYLAYLQKEYTAQAQENQVLLARAAAYKANADAALSYGNALKGHADTFGTLGTSSSQSLAGIQQFNAALVGLPDTVTTELDIDDSAALSKLAVYQSILRGVPQRVSTTDVITAAYATGGVNIPSAMPSEVVPISLGGPYQHQLNSLMAEIAQLSRDRVEIPVDFHLPDNAAMKAWINKTVPTVGPSMPLGGGGAGGGGGGPPPVPTPAMPGGEDPHALVSLWNQAAKAIADAGNASKDATPKLNDFHQTAYRGYGWWGLLNRNLTLFGGLLGSGGLLGHIAVWHVLLDGIIEALAVLIPATVTAALGLTAFAAAAEPAAKGVAERMYSIYQVSQATNSTIPPLTDNFKKFQDAVKPQVLQLFGDALDVMNKNGGTFGNLAVETGQVLDKLGARLTVFLTSGGSGFQKFLKTGSDDLKLFSGLLQSLGAIFANFLKATELTHIAEILLTVVDAVARLVAVVSSIPTPVLAALLALHGFIVWGGLATTVLLKVLDPIRAVSVALGGLKDASEVANLEKDATGWQKLRATLSDIANGFGALPGRLGLVKSAGKDAEAGLEDAAKGAADAGAAAANSGFKFTAIRTALTWIASNPATAAIGALVAAFVILGLVLGRTKDATDQWIDSMNKAVATANNWEAIPTTLNAVVDSQAKVAQKSSDVAKAFQEVSSQTGEMKGRFGDASGAMVGVGRDLDNLQAANDRYTKQLQAQTGFLDQVSKKTGFDYPQAVALANIAGVKLADITDKNSKEFKIALQQVQGLIDGYKAMGQQGGALGNDVNAVNLAMELQDTQVSKLNTAWDTFISLVTGGEQAFQKFGQDLNTLNTAAQVAGASFSGLDKNSIALQQGFTGAVVDGGKLLDQFRQQAIVMDNTTRAQDLLTRGGKDLIATLLPMAAKSKAAQDQVYALAQSAGYDGVNSLKALTKWSGNQGATGAEQDLLKVTGTLTGAVSDLATDYQNLADVLSTDVNKMMSDSILQANNAQKAFLDFAQGIDQGTTSSTKFHDATADIIKILLQQYSGDVPKAKAAFEAYAIQLGDTKAEADKLWDSMHGKVAVEMANQAVKTVPDAKKAFQTFATDGLKFTKDHADDLWKQLTSKLGPQMDGMGNLASGPVKNKFIDWAKNGLGLTQSQALSLWKELVTLQTKIDALHGKDVKVNFVGTGSGSIAFKESIPGVTVGPSSQGLLGFHAEGGLIDGRVPGYNPGVDSQAAMVSPGEFILTPEAAQAVGYDKLDAWNRMYAAGRKSGGGWFAGGGVVGTPGVSASFTGLEGPDGIISSGQARMGQVEAQFGEAVEKAFFDAVVKKFNADMNALAGSGPAIVQYARSFLGKIPYVFGGNSLSSGIDCSGFTQQVYGHFGIHAPRTSEAQFGWATKSAAIPGALAFYVSPAGGPPPGHVAIVQDSGNVISQGGGMGPRIEPIHFMPLMGTGVPKGGFPAAAGGTGNNAIGGGFAGTLSATQIEGYWERAGGPGGQVANIAQAITAPESGRRPGAVQQGQPYATTGWGLWQITPGNSEPQAGVDAQLLNPLNNAEAAVAKYTQAGFSFRPWTTYDNGLYRPYLLADGGMLPGYASGGAAGWKFPSPGGLHASDVTDKGFHLTWNPVKGPSGQAPGGYTVETWQLNNKLADKFTIPNRTWANEYGPGGRGLHPGWSYRTFVWANGGPQAPPHAQVLVPLQKAKTVAGLPAISTTAEDAYQAWFKNFATLDRDVVQETAAMWALGPLNNIGRKGGPTKAQEKTWINQMHALQAKQKQVIGVNIKPPGLYSQLKANVTANPQNIPDSLFNSFISGVSSLESMQSHDTLATKWEPGRSKALHAQLARLLADARTLHTAWQGTFGPGAAYATTPKARRGPTPDVSTGLENLVPLIIGGPATPVFDIGAGGPGMGFSGGGTIHPYANGGQVGLQQVASMFAGIMPTSMLVPSYMPGGISDTMLRKLSTSGTGSDEVPRKLSQAGAAHKAAFNVEQLNINNPVAEQPSLSIARASNRMAFLAGRGDS